MVGAPQKATRNDNLAIYPEIDSAVKKYFTDKKIDYEGKILFSKSYNNSPEERLKAFKSAIEDMKKGIKEGKVYDLGMVVTPITKKFKMYSSNEDNPAEITGSHSVYITGVGEDCLYVSSWGREYKIKFTDLNDVNSEFTIYESKIN